ncbi:BACON domain-containing protein [uncultured Alistipes sp.]|jgi:lipoprotein|uniref:BACON domain-containing protein n=1 Tax=uncultured Alistipes sp. TaxID=538949 RepID=UPI0025EC60F5|nr:BACON domain-containing protein [uncultured Alistipes sp.]
MKNINFLLKYAIGIAMLSYLTLSTGCKEDDNYVLINNYIEVSDDGYTFRALGGELTINVNPVPDGTWIAQIKNGADWLTEVSRQETAYTVRADLNISSSADTRTATIVFTSGKAIREITVLQDAIVEGYKLDQNGVAPRLVKLPAELTTIVMSDNGKYVVGIGRSMPANADQYHYYPVIFETSKPDRENWTIFPESAMYKWEAKGVADTGDFLIDSRSPLASAYHCAPDGTMNSIEGAGYSSVQFSGISANGSVWVGAVTHDGTDTPQKNSAVKWVNGVSEILPAPELNIWREVSAKGQYARGVSADGSIIYGSDCGYDDTELSAVYWDANGEYRIFGKDLVEFNEQLLYPGTSYEKLVPWTKHVRQIGTLTNLSRNGKYYTSTFWNLDIVNFINSPRDMHPYIYNLETGEEQVLYDYSNHSGITVSDDGLVSIGYPAVNSNQCLIYDFAAETEPITANEYLLERYGINLGKNVIIEKFCSDGKTILGKIPALGIGASPEYFYIYYPDRMTVTLQQNRL